MIYTILSLCQFCSSCCSLLGLCNFIMDRHVFWLFSHASGTCWTSSVLKMSYLEIASFQNHCWMMRRKRWKPLLELLPFVLLLCKDPVPGIHQSMTWVVWCLACGVLKVDSTCLSSGEFFPLVFSFQSWTLFDATQELHRVSDVVSILPNVSLSSQNHSTLPVAYPVSRSNICPTSTKVRIGAKTVPVILTSCFSSMMLMFRQLFLKNFGKGQRCS